MIESFKKILTTIGGLIGGILVLAVGGIAGKAMFQVAPLLIIPIVAGVAVYWCLKKLQTNASKGQIITSTILAAFLAFSLFLLLISDYVFYDIYIISTLFLWYTFYHSKIATISVLMFAVLAIIVSLTNMDQLANNQTIVFWGVSNGARVALVLLTLYELKNDTSLKSDILSFPSKMNGTKAVVSASIFVSCAMFSSMYFDGFINYGERSDPAIGVVLPLTFIAACLYFYIFSKIVSINNEGIKRLSLVLYFLGVALGVLFFYMNNGTFGYFDDVFSMQLICMMVGGLLASTASVFVAKTYIWVASGFNQN